MHPQIDQGCVFSPEKNPTGVADIPSLACLAQVVVNIINLAFMFLGAVTLLMLLFGAIKFITSSGDPKAIQGAQKTMTYAIIGAIVVMMAFVLVNLATQTLGLGTVLDKFTFFQGS